MFGLQTHCRMTFKNSQYVRFFIFADETKEHSRIVLRDHERLQCLPRLVDFNFLKFIFCASSLPEGLVTIENNDLVGGCVKRMYFPGKDSSERVKKRWTISNAGKFVCAMIVNDRNGIKSNHLQ